MRGFAAGAHSATKRCQLGLFCWCIAAAQGRPGPLKSTHFQSHCQCTILSTQDAGQAPVVLRQQRLASGRQRGRRDGEVRRGAAVPAGLQSRSHIRRAEAPGDKACFHQEGGSPKETMHRRVRQRRAAAGASPRRRHGSWRWQADSILPAGPLFLNPSRTGTSAPESSSKVPTQSSGAGRVLAGLGVTLACSGLMPRVPSPSGLSLPKPEVESEPPILCPCDRQPRDWQDCCL